MDWFALDSGLQYLISTEVQSAPNPILFSIGSSIPLGQFQGPFYWETGLLFWGTTYRYLAGKAFPTEPETADNLWVLATHLDTRIGLSFKLGERARLGTGIGLATIFRIPIVGEGTQDRQDMTAYFLSRFLYPELEVFYSAGIRENLALAFSLRGLFPIFHLWDGEGASFQDQLIVMGLVSFRFLIR
jgi:hypothetical protein